MTSADELHDRVIDAMQSWFARNRIPEPPALVEPYAMPLAQTVLSCLVAAHLAGLKTDH